MLSVYRGKSVVITGGLGFVGSNLAIRLVQLGARVKIIDSLEPECGANAFNIACVRSDVAVVIADIGDPQRCDEALRGAEFVLNLAGDVSHSRSMQDPERDLSLNSASQLRFLLSCRRLCPRARIVYAGTRQVYGQHEYLPVDESHPIQPVDFNGVHKYAATQYHLLLHWRGDLDCVVLRLSNVYGPRMALHLVHQGFLSVYLRNALEGRPLQVYGDGDSLRDPVHVDDVVTAFLLAGATPEPLHRIYNVGGAEACSVAQIAELMAREGGKSDVVKVPFPDELRRIDIGSYYSDTRRATTELSWIPRVSLDSGTRETLRYYKQHFQHYLPFPSQSALQDDGPNGQVFKATA